MTDQELIDELEGAGHLEAAGALRRKLNAAAAVDPFEAAELGGGDGPAATLRRGFAEAADPETVRLRRRRKIADTEEADDE